MIRIVTAVSVLLGVGLAGTAIAAYSEGATAPCKNHPTMTLDDYLALAHERTFYGETKKDLPAGDYRLLVPKGLKIENRAAMFYASEGPADFYPLPAHEKEFFSTGGTRFFGEFMSPCRVQSPDGRWWAVEFVHSYIEYTPLESVDEEKLQPGFPKKKTTREKPQPKK